MKRNEPFSLKARSRSFRYAVKGIGFFFKTEHNAFFHLLATIGIIFLGIIFPVSGLEATALVLCIGFVWVAELFNTVIEKIMDFISKEEHPQIKFIKDMSAAAVLIAAAIAVVVGCLVFIPKF